MSKVDANQLKHYREGIERMLKTIPPSVRNGSYQRSISYKDAVDKAQKALKAPNSLARLSAAHNELASYY